MKEGLYLVGVCLASADGERALLKKGHCEVEDAVSVDVGQRHSLLRAGLGERVAVGIGLQGRTRGAEDDESRRGEDGRGEERRG